MKEIDSWIGFFNLL